MWPEKSKVAWWYSYIWRAVKQAPKNTVKDRPWINPFLSSSNKAWCAHVTVVPDSKRTKVFISGISHGSNVSISFGGQTFPTNSFGNKLGCFCFEKQTLKPGEKASYDLVFYLDPELVNDPKTKNIEDVTMSYTFFSSDYYKVEKNES